MRLQIPLLSGMLFFALIANGQNDVSLKMELSQAEARTGEPFEVKFVLENGNNARFSPPDWESVHLTVVQSSQSSSFSFSNGKSSSTAVYSYQVVAADTGTVQIPVAIASVGGKEYRSEAQTIRISPGDSNGQYSPRPTHPSQPQNPPQDPKKKIKTIRL